DAAFGLELLDRRVRVVAARRARERTPLVVPSDRARFDGLEPGRWAERGLLASVDDDRVERATELRARGLTAEVGRAAPDDLVLEGVTAEDLVEDRPDEVSRAPVEVHPDGAPRRKQPRERLEPRREHVQIGPEAPALSRPTILVRERAKGGAV